MRAARGIEQVPGAYDALCAAAEALGLRAWRRWLAAGARGRTLDLGCGTGRTLALLPAGVRAVGVDPEAAVLARARRRAPRAALVRARAEALPFRAGAFDTVLCGLVLCSVDDPPRALAEVRRVLAPGGTVRLWEHVRSPVPWRARLEDRLQPLWTRLTGGCRPNRATEAAVAAAGFVVDERRARGPLRRFVARPR